MSETPGAVLVEPGSDEFQAQREDFSIFPRLWRSDQALQSCQRTYTPPPSQQLSKDAVGHALRLLVTNAKQVWLFCLSRRRR